jgi:O-antigen/teichoic acid export membrane protein
MGKSVIVKNLIWKFSERVLAQIVSLIVTIVLARLLDPQHYGTVARVTVFITIADAFVTSGIPASLIQAKDVTEEHFSSVFYFNLVFSCLLYLLMFITAPFISVFYKDVLLTPLIRVMGLRIIVAAVNSVQHAFVSRNMMFKKYFFSTLFGTLVSGIVGISLAYFGFGPWALVGQYLSNTLIDTVVLFFTVAWRPLLFFSWEKVKSLLGFGWRMLFEGVFGNIYAQMQNLVIGRCYTSADLAYYNKGEQLPSIVINNISISISSVLFPAMASRQENKEDVTQLLRKSARYTSYVVFPILTMMAGLSDSIITILLTDKWLGCSVYMKIFCVIYALQVGMYPRHQALNGIGRSDVFMNEHIVGRCVGIVVLLLLYRKGVLAVGISGLIGTTVQGLIIMYTSFKYNDYRLVHQITDVLHIVFACTIVYVSLIAIEMLIPNVWLNLIVGAMAGGLEYLLLMNLMKSDEQDYLLGIFKSYVRRIKA